MNSFWKEKLKIYRDKFVQHRFFYILFGLTLLTACFWELKKNKRESLPPIQRKEVDTYIPAGYTLVPIDVQNLESLDSVFGNYGIVDLYAQHGESGSKQVAQQIKMLRSPNNPSVFAVLVRADRTQLIARHPGPYFVVVHNRKSQSLDGPFKAPIKARALTIINEDL